MVDFISEAKKIENDIISWRRRLHKIPEIGFNTPKTSKYLEDVLENLNIEYEKGYGNSGIVAKIYKDKNNNKTFAIRADIDAVEIEEKTGLKFSSVHENKMHACGHDAHTAMALGASKIISENFNKFNGNVKILFQPAEEGPGGARKMIEDGALVNPNVGAIIGLHVDPGTLYDDLKQGQIGIKSGPAMACLDKFKIEVVGEGGHGGYPESAVDPIAISASIIENLQTIVSREISPLEPAVISICKINGGTKYNVIPEKVVLEGTTRFFTKKQRDIAQKRMNSISEKIANARNGKVNFEYHEGYPVLINSQEITDYVINAAKEIFNKKDLKVLKRPIMGGEDMSFYLNEIPGAFFFLGAEKDGNEKPPPLHSSYFDIEEKVLWKGSALFAKIAYDWLNKKS